MSRPPRQPWHEFEYHDTLGPIEGWPGGDRWGYTYRREVRVPRNWTPAEHRLAEELGIVLVGVDSCTIELWWDGPARHYYEMPPRPPATFLTLADPFDDLPQPVPHSSRKYGRRVWDRPNPLPAAAYRAGQRGVEEAIRALT